MEKAIVTNSLKNKVMKNNKNLVNICMALDNLLEEANSLEEFKMLYRKSIDVLISEANEITRHICDKS